MTNKRKIKFADFIVIFCIIISVIITACVIFSYLRIGSEIPCNVVVALLSFWGGELLTIALRQIFGSDLLTKTAAMKTVNNNDNSI